MHYEKSGDQFVGRVVAGLPLNSADFAVLPPHFATAGNLVLGLASIVHHADFLRTTLPSSHPVLHTAIFRDNFMISNLKALVRTTSKAMKPTGLPPYVEI
ncbi:hypothetical protein H310_15143 [Aphanomyces invadans]|uniref:Uncharacterized protein n=1 Tax=Aphanomyces invadans TaxID=157072 RepID=A0A024T807_9STRA|nr:hypothetical protein H310_15143 [Aphanomyces invadans]ETV90024.1 hypothetical protein H310_15143 [Aphanomyces invadans]|eukprot:XP_008881345.1 hypothetical protein H310_15143 [Aphanomyces invadans]